MFQQQRGMRDLYPDAATASNADRKNQ